MYKCRVGYSILVVSLMDMAHGMCIGTINGGCRADACHKSSRRRCSSTYKRPDEPIRRNLQYPVWVLDTFSEYVHINIVGNVRTACESALELHVKLALWASG